MIGRILVPVDFSPCSDAALGYALAIADACGAEVEVLHVWSPADAVAADSLIFAETPQGHALEARLSAAETEHPARVSGRLEFGEEPSTVILDILDRENFDLVVMGCDGARAAHRISPMRESGHVTENVRRTARCKVVALRDTGEPIAAA